LAQALFPLCKSSNSHQSVTRSEPVILPPLKLLPLGYRPHLIYFNTSPQDVPGGKPSPFSTKACLSAVRFINQFHIKINKNHTDANRTPCCISNNKFYISFEPSGESIFLSLLLHAIKDNRCPSTLRSKTVAHASKVWIIENRAIIGDTGQKPLAIFQYRHWATRIKLQTT